jgi:hypothetical protein
MAHLNGGVSRCGLAGTVDCALAKCLGLRKLLRGDMLVRSARGGQYPRFTDNELHVEGLGVETRFGAEATFPRPISSL